MDKEKLKNYIYENFMSFFWSCFLLLGGGVFVAYYSYIGYMPEFDFQSSVIILAGASITSIFIITILIVTFILPGLFWSSSIGEKSKIKSRWQDDKGNKALSKTSLWFGIPVMFFYGFAIIFPFSWKIAFIYLVIGILIAVVLLYKVLGLQKKELAKEFFYMTFTYLCCSVLMLLPMYTLITLSSSEVELSKGSPVLIGIIVAAFTLFANVVATAKPKNSNGLIYFPFLGGLTLVVVLSSFEVFHRVPERVMEIYNFGAIKTKAIVFNKDGCKALERHGFTFNIQDNELCVINNAKILSRLGTDMYLEIDSLRLTIENKNVLSWSIKNPE